MKLLKLILVLALSAGVQSQLPTLYQHYTAGGIKTGLVPTSTGFLLNGKPFRLISGAIHYFRVHPDYWRDRLRKLRATGANAVETYVAWNLHEPQKNVFDFGQGNNDMSLFLDLVRYIEIAKEEDLFVVFRPGPYICSEWDFGGLPSWLMTDYTMRVRTMYQGYIERVDAFFDQLIPLVTELQFTRGNGAIIAVQVENEYGAFGYGDQPRDKVYLKHLRDKMTALGIESMYLTSDDPTATHDWGAIDGALHTANLQDNPGPRFQRLRQLQPGMPAMVTEFWSGWFDHWTDARHNGLSVARFEETLGQILNLNASVNFYMFHGGTNFGFLNGANALDNEPHYLPDVTSYDYDSPLSESGDYTPKYDVAAQLIPAALAVPTRLPARPNPTPKRAYAAVKISEYLTLNELIVQVPEGLKVQSDSLLAMEELPINDGNGQSFGFIVYRKVVKVRANSLLQVRGHIRDMAQVLINGQNLVPPVRSKQDLYKFGSWFSRDQVLILNSWKPLKNIVENYKSTATMDIVVENLGRVNYGKPHHFFQKKGLWEGPVSLDGVDLTDWTIVALEFKGSWVRSLQNWRPFTSAQAPGPLLVRGSFLVNTVADTFVDMSGWGKGVVFVNGFNLGRYWSTVGPQKTLYLPAPLLKVGFNTIVIYEQYEAAGKVDFVLRPDLGHPSY